MAPLLCHFSAVSVLPSACHSSSCNGGVYCTAPACHSTIEASLDCSTQVLLAPGMGYMGPSQRVRLCASPKTTFRSPCRIQRNHGLMLLVSFRCRTAQYRNCPLWCVPNVRQTYGSTAERGIIIISISHYHNEIQGRKQMAAHGTKPARCSQFLYYQLCQDHRVHGKAFLIFQSCPPQLPPSCQHA